MARDVLCSSQNLSLPLFLVSASSSQDPIRSQSSPSPYHFYKRAAGVAKSLEIGQVCVPTWPDLVREAMKSSRLQGAFYLRLNILNVYIISS